MEALGRGGMATVYLARQSDLERFVAVKELDRTHSQDPAFAQRFKRESRTIAKLQHPNIVTVHAFIEQDGRLYIAMEYVPRGSLRDYMGRLTVQQIAGVLEGVFAGLAYAHAQPHGGIVHRDIKPENIMITADGGVKIADFGIAKAAWPTQTSPALTAAQTAVGTPPYMAPEQAMAQAIGPWTDLYSVGCMAYELFTGQVPFADTSAPMAIMLRHVNEPIPPAITLRPDLDPRISDWIDSLLVKTPAERVQSARDAWEGFEEIVLALHGPRWRRDARLTEGDAPAASARPLTPPPFTGPVSGKDASDEWETFVPGGSEPAPPTDGAQPVADAELTAEPPVASGPLSDVWVTVDRERFEPARPPVESDISLLPPREPVVAAEVREAPPAAIVGHATPSAAETPRRPVARPPSMATTLAPQRPLPAPPTGRVQRRRWRWLPVFVLLAALAAAATLFLRGSGTSPPPPTATPAATATPTTIPVTTDAYTLQLPAGWTTSCVESGSGDCSVRDRTLRRSAFIGDNGQQLSIDRFTNSGATLASMADSQDTALRKKAKGYERSTASYVPLAPGRRVREFAFTSRAPGWAFGNVDVFKAGGDVYVVTTTDADPAAAKSMARAVAKQIHIR